MRSTILLEKKLDDDIQFHSALLSEDGEVPDSLKTRIENFEKRFKEVRANNTLERYLFPDLEEVVEQDTTALIEKFKKRNSTGGQSYPATEPTKALAKMLKQQSFPMPIIDAMLRLAPNDSDAVAGVTGKSLQSRMALSIIAKIEDGSYSFKVKKKDSGDSGDETDKIPEMKDRSLE